MLSYAAQMRRAFPCTTIYLSYHSHPIRPRGAPSPRGEGYYTRITSSKKGGEAATSTLNLEPNESKAKRTNPRSDRKPYPSCLSYHVCPIRSPSTVIPSAAEGSLLHCRHMHTCTLTQTTPWCFLFRLSLTHVLPVCKKDPPTSALMTRKKDGSSHIVFHTAA